MRVLVSVLTSMKAKYILIAVALLTAATGAFLFAFSNQSPGKKDLQLDTSAVPRGVSLPQRSSQGRSYNDIRSGIESQRIALAQRYRRATNQAQQADVIAEAREALTQLINIDIFPLWYGTAWDFNGTTQTPGQGKIACGYFVSTVLRDTGLRVERVKLAQQASENIILSLTTESHIKRFRRAAINDFVAAVREWGPGLYVVGLDIHVGFIFNTGGEVYFIHSSYIEPFAVVKEIALESKILTASQHRVIGKVSADDQLIVKWLMGNEVATRTA
jgi:hypothetical protein